MHVYLKNFVQYNKAIRSSKIDFISVFNLQYSLMTYVRLKQVGPLWQDERLFQVAPSEEVGFKSNNFFFI